MDWRFWRKPSWAVFPIEKDDLPALAEIHRASFPHGWRADELDRMLDSNGMIGLVARREGGSRRPFGFVLARSSGEEAEILTIATAPAARRGGVGRALMDAVKRQLLHDRVKRLFLEVSAGNMAAQTLYRSMGFRQVGERKAYYASHVEGGKSAAGHTSAPPLNAPPSALVMELDLR